MAEVSAPRRLPSYGVNSRAAIGGKTSSGVCARPCPDVAMTAANPTAAARVQPRQEECLAMAKVYSRFANADAAGHVERGVERQTLEEAMEWVWATGSQ